MEKTTMEIVRWLADKKTFFFTHNNKLYKAKLLSINHQTATIYLFHTKEIINIPLSHITMQNTKQHHEISSDTITSPLCGRITNVYVTPNQYVTKDQILITIESMKMENEIRAHTAFFIKSISIEEGHLVKQGQVLLHIKID